jgi:hypothetical protein
MSFVDLGTKSDKATGQKDLSPKGFANNGPATSLLPVTGPWRTCSFVAPRQRAIPGETAISIVF